MPHVLESVEDQLANDALLPAQQVSERHLTACQDLWLAILRRALHDLVGHTNPTSLSPSGVARIAKQAATWFESEDEEIGSFLWVSATLSLDPLAFRSRLNQSSGVAANSKAPELSVDLRGV